MADCVEIARKLEAYVDDELSGTERIEVEEHLTICLSCLDRKEFRVVFQRVIQRACGRADLPPHLAERIRSAIGEA